MLYGEGSVEQAGNGSPGRSYTCEPDTCAVCDTACQKREEWKLKRIHLHERGMGVNMSMDWDGLQLNEETGCFSICFSENMGRIVEK